MIVKVGANLIFMENYKKLIKIMVFLCLSWKILKISKNVLNKNYRPHQNTHFMFHAFSSYDCFREN